jgi:hypothetical protein
MSGPHKHDWQELKIYLEGYIQAQVDKDMQDSELIFGTMEESRLNAIENLQHSVRIIFGDDIYRDEIESSNMNN